MAQTEKVESKPRITDSREEFLGWMVSGTMVGWKTQVGQKVYYGDAPTLYQHEQELARMLFVTDKVTKTEVRNAMAEQYLLLLRSQKT